jgi:hydroxymethylpyrimidine pyrophosphatase-like HAD family hydrolase
MRIAFDVDGTLITLNEYPEYGGREQPRWEIVEMLKTLHRAGHEIVVWSGGGGDYAELWVRRLFLKPYVKEACGKPITAPTFEGKRLPFCDLCFDDEEVNLAKVNVKV